MKDLTEMNSLCYNVINDRLIQEADQLISHIERGSNVLKFYPRKRPERKTLSVRRETHQVIWYRNGSLSRQAFEGSLEIRDIKEIRMGKSSKDFDRWPEDAKRLEQSKCFTVYYGTEFKLRSASFAGKNYILKLILSCFKDNCLVPQLLIFVTNNFECTYISSSNNIFKDLMSFNI